MSPRIRLALTLTLCACQPPPADGPAITYSPCDPVMLRAAADSRPAELQSIGAAIALWSEVGMNTLSAIEVAGGTEVPVQFKEGPAPFHGVYEPSSGVVLINRGLEGEERDVTLAHEVGHALGLPHLALSVRPSVMNPGNLTVRPTPEDQAELQRLWSCPGL